MKLTKRQSVKYTRMQWVLLAEHPEWEKEDALRVLMPQLMSWIFSPPGAAGIICSECFLCDYSIRTCGESETCEVCPGNGVLWKAPPDDDDDYPEEDTGCEESPSPFEAWSYAPNDKARTKHALAMVDGCGEILVNINSES